MKRTDCPSREAFEKSFRTDATLAERESLIDHALVCPSCRAKVDVLLDAWFDVSSRGRRMRSLAKSSLAELRAAAGPRTRTEARPRGAWLRPAAALGVLMALALSAVFLIGPLARKDGVLRDGESGGLVLLSPKGEIEGFPAEFRWDAPVGADAFFLEVIDDHLSVIIPKTGTLGRFFSLPIGWESRFVPGRTYIWIVTAYDDALRTVGTAQRSFTIRPGR